MLSAGDSGSPGRMSHFDSGGGGVGSVSGGSGGGGQLRRKLSIEGELFFNKATSSYLDYLFELHLGFDYQ